MRAMAMDLNSSDSEDLGIGKTVWLDLIMVEDVDKVSNEEFSTTQHKGVNVSCQGTLKGELT